VQLIQLVAQVGVLPVERSHWQSSLPGSRARTPPGTATVSVAIGSADCFSVTFPIVGAVANVLS
jgi:hypothetical protein